MPIDCCFPDSISVVEQIGRDDAGRVHDVSICVQPVYQAKGTQRRIGWDTVPLVLRVRVPAIIEITLRDTAKIRAAEALAAPFWQLEGGFCLGPHPSLEFWSLVHEERFSIPRQCQSPLLRQDSCPDGEAPQAVFCGLICIFDVNRLSLHPHKVTVRQRVMQAGDDLGGCECDRPVGLLYTLCGIAAHQAIHNTLYRNLFQGILSGVPFAERDDDIIVAISQAGHFRHMVAQ